MTDSNSVDIKIKGSNVTIKKITYLFDTLNAPDGTPDPIIEEKKTGTEWKITVKCDRKGSATFAETYNTTCGGGSSEYAPYDGGPGKEPDKLNFYFGVSIVYSYKDGSTTKEAVAAEVYLGQGNSGVRNNWWIGGVNTIVNTDNKTPMLLASGGVDNIVLGISGGVSDFQFEWKAKTANIDLSRWLDKVDGAKSLNVLTLPGTHETCALYGGDLVECQKRVLADQLAAGIRFIDIRCRHIDDVFTIHHGLVYQKINFGDGVLKVCLDFLAGHPSETIVMSIKEEYDPSNNTRTFEQTFEWYLEKYNCRDRWWLADTVPSLNQVRGKIVLFRRFPAAQTPMGLRAEPWEENKTFTINNANAPMSIQDQYKVPTIFDRGKKWDAVNAQLQAAKTGSSTTLYVNFCSGTSSGCYPYTCANYINPRVAEYFTTNISGRYGCVLQDFESSDRNRLIAETNL